MMKTFVKITALSLLVALVSSGCCSYAVMKSSQKRIASKRALASGNESAIKAVRLGSDGVGFGIDVGNLEALTEQPLLQLGAAIIDAGIIYGVSEGIKAYEDSNDDKGTIEVTGDGNEVNITTITGDGNNGNADHEQDNSVVE